MGFAPGGGIDQEQFLDLYGYGISSTIVSPRPPNGYDVADPNATIVNSLMPEQAKAYESALIGGGEGEGPSCTEIARQANPDAPDPLRELGGRLGQLEQLIADDERIGAAEAAWRRCMTKSGWETESPQALRESFQVQANEISPEVAAELERQGAPSGEVDLINSLSIDLRERIEALTEEEVRAAKADYECSKELRSTHLEVLREHYLALVGD